LLSPRQLKKRNVLPAIAQSFPQIQKGRERSRIPCPKIQPPPPASGKKRRRLSRPQTRNKFESFFLTSPSWHYDSRALSGAPIVPLPRNRLASSAIGGASPISMCVTIYTSQAASVENARQWRAFYARSGLQAPN
jgi:hypothetical protein